MGLKEFINKVRVYSHIFGIDIALVQLTWVILQARVLRTVCQKPSFFFMVSQGVSGGIPWHAFAFLPFYFQLSGYTDSQAAQILLYGGLSRVVWPRKPPVHQDSGLSLVASWAACLAITAMASGLIAGGTKRCQSLV